MFRLFRPFQSHQKVTIVLPTPIRPFKRISLLLNKRSAASLEQLLLDVTEAFQIPRWHNDHVRRLYTLRGKIIKSLSEIFRADDPVFIAMGRDEITPQIITHAVEGKEARVSIFDNIMLCYRTTSKLATKPRKYSVATKDNSSTANAFHQQPT